MTHEEFVDLVAKMRHHQREFFRARRQEDLNESRKLEKSVDQAIETFKQGGYLL